MECVYESYAERLLQLILARGNTLPRTYGFEYEFLSDRILTLDDMSLVKSFLCDRGYSLNSGVYMKENRSIVFEPGGQIEYLSPPLKGAEVSRISDVLDWIGETNAAIEKELGIRYIGTDYFPGRYSAPLLLTSERYFSMHERFKVVDIRGPEMMKGTAAIHLHAAITSADDLAELYPVFCGMASSDLLGMSDQRRDIWNRTDNCRCRLPVISLNNGALSILEGVVQFAMNAINLQTGKPFEQSTDMNFDAFLDHLTTMFTDVRINVKGGTIELRTPDSRPLEDFPELWERFIQECEAV